MIFYGNHLFTSLNIPSKLIKYDLVTQKIVRTANTEKLPRTIAISKDGQVIFVVCYKGDYLQAFSADNLALLGKWQSRVHPVCVDVYQEGDIIEAWVGNHSSGTLKVFTFRKK